MKFCQQHWDTLRQKLADRAIDHLVPQGGKQAMKQVVDQISKGEETRENFDPLMGAHWAIAGNILQTCDKTGNRELGLYIMFGGDAQDVCPLCEMNKAHRETCTDARCTLDKERGYDWMLDSAADDELARARELGLLPAVQ